MQICKIKTKNSLFINTTSTDKPDSLYQYNSQGIIHFQSCKSSWREKSRGKEGILVTWNNFFFFSRSFISFERHTRYDWTIRELFFSFFIFFQRPLVYFLYKLWWTDRSMFSNMTCFFFILRFHADYYYSSRCNY